MIQRGLRPELKHDPYSPVTVDHGDVMGEAQVHLSKALEIYQRYGVPHDVDKRLIRTYIKQITEAIA